MTRFCKFIQLSLCDEEDTGFWYTASLKDVVCHTGILVYGLLHMENLITYIRLQASCMYVFFFREEK